MTAWLPQVRVLQGLCRDGRLLFLARSLRLFGFGAISVILVLYLSELKLSASRIGLLLTLTLLGDTALSLFITTTADRAGRRAMLFAGAVLLAGAGAVFSVTDSFGLLLLAATLGIISPSGYEVGPFLAIEQAALSQLIPAAERTAVFAWYNVAGSAATALGALAGGAAVDLLRRLDHTPLESYRAVLLAYAATGLVLAGLFGRLSAKTEAPPDEVQGRGPKFLGLHQSRGAVFQLSALFALDAFAGGFIVQSIAAYWFHVRFGLSASTLGAIFFGANLLAGISALAAASLAKRFGLLNTMVFTHLPSNLLLILVPLMPNLALALAVLLLRFSISQMDVPTRQAYTMALVAPGERAAASGVTGVARTAGAALSPWLAGLLLAVPGLLSAPFFLAGGLKVVYDLLLFRYFGKHKLPEE